MNKIFLKSITPIFPLIIIYTQCNVSNKPDFKTTTKPEGFIVLAIKWLNKVEKNDPLASENYGADSILFSEQRKMFIYRHFLIDVKTSDHFLNEKYTKTDTLGYEFYDLVTQHYASFETLSFDSKIIRRGAMTDSTGAFSNTPEYDPMLGVPDSIWTIADTVINKNSSGIVNFVVGDWADSTEMEYLKRTKFWVNYMINDFPLQLSYILSKKLKNGFVYKMQQSSPDAKTIMVTTLDYQESKLPDTIKYIFEKWSQIVNE